MRDDNDIHDEYDEHYDVDEFNIHDELAERGQLADDVCESINYDPHAFGSDDNAGNGGHHYDKRGVDPSGVPGGHPGSSGAGASGPDDDHCTKPPGDGN